MDKTTQKCTARIIIVICRARAYASPFTVGHNLCDWKTDGGGSHGGLPARDYAKFGVRHCRSRLGCGLRLWRTAQVKRCVRNVCFLCSEANRSRDLLVVIGWKPKGRRLIVNQSITTLMRRAMRARWLRPMCHIQIASAGIRIAAWPSVSRRGLTHCDIFIWFGVQIIMHSTECM